MLKATLITIFVLLSQACAFTPEKFSPNLREISPVQFSDWVQPITTRPGSLTSTLAGVSTGLLACITKVMAEDDYEIAELPPVYVPALFGLVLVAGVGVLTASLGNVMDEEASLGLQSGARAKKEIERSRSSYFKR